MSPAARAQIEKKVLQQAREQQKKTIPEKNWNKLHAEKVEYNGTVYDSKHELKRYKQLEILERAGAISDLQYHVPFELIPKQRKSEGKVERGVKYEADFVYRKDGKLVVEDAKGYRGGATYQVFVLKRKLMLYVHGIEVKEV